MNQPLPTQTRIVMQSVRRAYGIRASLDELAERVNRHASGLKAKLMLSAIEAERAAKARQ